VASKVEESGVAAQEVASAAPVLTVAELLDMRQSRLRMKEALLDEAAAFSKDDVNQLRFRLGEAILSSGKTIQTLFKEWDKNNDGGAHRPCLHTEYQRQPERALPPAHAPHLPPLHTHPCTLILADSSLHSLTRVCSSGAVLSKVEFKQGIRLSLTMRASNDEIDEVFDSFDVRAEGSRSMRARLCPTPMNAPALATQRALALTPAAALLI
jgi:hypothetical protein